MTTIATSGYTGPETVIDPLELNNEFVRVPSDLATWNARYADAVEAHLRAKRQLALLEADLYVANRAPDKPKMTEAHVDALVTMDNRYQVLQARVDDAEVEKARVAGVVEAIRAKKDTLISLGANLRAERERDPQVNENRRR